MIFNASASGKQPCYRVANNTQPAIDVDIVIVNQLYPDRNVLIAILPEFSVFSPPPKKKIGGLAPIWVRRCKLHPPYRLVTVS